MKRGFVSAAERRAPLSRAWLWSLGLLCLMQSVSAGPVSGQLASATPGVAKQVVVATGVASYYADKFHGRTTANGETFDMYALTAAHRTLPFGTKLKVTSLANNRSVLVRINDRGPFVNGRIIDLSLGAAKEIQMIQSGLAPVKLEIIK
jgi:rare lipoprotein A